jgi:hypothetical protein
MRVRNAAERLEVTVDNISTVSALLLSPENPKACFIFAHGAGAGMTHAFMEAVAMGLADRRYSDLALSISLHGDGSQNSRCTGDGTCHGACCRGGSRTQVPWPAPARW